MLTIGLIDNFLISRLGLTILINDFFKDVLVLEAGTIPEYGVMHHHQRPDVIIFGNNALHEDKSLEAAKQLKKLSQDIPLIIYDDRLQQNLTIPYFRIGINGYLLRQNTAEEMVDCINVVLSGKRYLSPTLNEHLLNSISPGFTETTVMRKPILTRRELEIARYVVQGMKTSQISDMLSRKASTISSIKHNIFRKLNVKNTSELLEAFSEYKF